MKIDKVLFLDVDGVLNSHNSGGPFTLNKRKLRMLTRVVRRTGCLLVLSSSWRKSPEHVLRLRNRLKHRDLKIFDLTTSQQLKEDQVRGDEIDYWLKENPWVSRYAIVDDDSDFYEHQQPFLVLTDGNVGLTDSSVEKLIQILNGEAKWNS